MTRLGVFGGTFNPPHTAHLTVAQRAMRQARLDEVLWIPAANPPHKPEEKVVDARHRMEMVRRLIEDEPAFRLCDLELRRTGPSYTADTLDELARRRPDAALYLIIGEDSLRRLHTWNSPERIAQRVEDILVYRRPERTGDVGVDELFQNRYTLLDGDPVNVSSSDIRGALAHGEGSSDPDGTDPTDDLPADVLEYIRSNDLYALPD